MPAALSQKLFDSCEDLPSRWEWLHISCRNHLNWACMPQEILRAAVGRVHDVREKVQLELHQCYTTPPPPPFPPNTGDLALNQKKLDSPIPH